VISTGHGRHFPFQTYKREETQLWMGCVAYQIVEANKALNQVTRGGGGAVVIVIVVFVVFVVVCLLCSYFLYIFLCKNSFLMSSFSSSTSGW
jgi:hypothetical protein